MLCFVILFELQLHQSTHQPNENANALDSPKLTKRRIQNFNLPFQTGKLWHKFQLLPTNTSDFAASTFQDRWITVDYIFYTKFLCRSQVPEPPKYSPLQLLANYRLPSIKQCERMGPIPNDMFGSDHYLLAAEFTLLS